MKRKRFLSFAQGGHSVKCKRLEWDNVCSGRWFIKSHAVCRFVFIPWTTQVRNVFCGQQLRGLNRYGFSDLESHSGFMILPLVVSCCFWGRDPVSSWKEQLLHRTEENFYSMSMGHLVSAGNGLTLATIHRKPFETQWQHSYFALQKSWAKKKAAYNQHPKAHRKVFKSFNGATMMLWASSGILRAKATLSWKRLME